MKEHCRNIATVMSCDTARVTAVAARLEAPCERPPPSSPFSFVAFTTPSPRAIELTPQPAASVETSRACDPSTGRIKQRRQAFSRLSIMCDLLSLSVLQVLSVLSFLTSILAVLHVGAGPLHRLSNKFDADVPSASHFDLNAAKQHGWNWSGLQVSFSLGTLIGDDSREHGAEKGVGGYMGGSDLMRMNWQVGRPRLGPQIYESQAPLSMAKLIMSRHSQRRPFRLPRRTAGMPRPTPPSRLMESVV